MSGGAEVYAAGAEVTQIRTIPLSLTATLNLANRRRQICEIQEQQRLEVAHLIQRNQDDTHAELMAVQKATEGVQSRVEQLTQQEAKSMATLTAQTEQFAAAIATLQTRQAERELIFSSLSEQDQTVRAELDQVLEAIYKVNL